VSNQVTAWCTVESAMTRPRARDCHVYTAHLQLSSVIAFIVTTPQQFQRNREVFIITSQKFQLTSVSLPLVSPPR